MDASQNIVAYLRGDKDLKEEISQTTMFNFHSKKNIKITLYQSSGLIICGLPKSATYQKFGLGQYCTLRLWYPYAISSVC